MSPGQDLAIQTIRKLLEQQKDFSDSEIYSHHKSLVLALTEAYNKGFGKGFDHGWDTALTMAADIEGKDTITCGEAGKCGCCGPCGIENYYISRQSILNLKVQ